MKRILIIDDDQSLCLLLQRFLTKNGFEVEVAFTSSAGIDKFKERGADLVLCDFRLDVKNGDDVLKAIKVLDPHAVFITITGYSDVKTAVAILKDGAYDYISKPLIPDEILKVINKALEQQNKPRTTQPSRSMEEQNTVNKKTNGTSKGNATLPNDHIIMGDSATIKDLFRQVDLVAPTNCSVIIYGESGSGKEVMARAIHSRSGRCDHPFVALDCGTLSKELAGSELFGHAKGSFTGAVNEKEGHFEMANGGTLFLDEVGNLSLDIQASLLRVIQERRFKRVGGINEIEVNIRILVASNENLQDACRTGRFREDLFHRLNEFSIAVPPLRNRKEDIPLFAEYFLAKANKELNKDVMGFEQEVMELFMKYRWPGNLREMMNVIRRTALLARKNNAITRNVLPLEFRDMGLISGEAGKHNSSGSLKDAASNAEYDTILEVLKKANYNKTRAAEMLNIDRKTLYNKLRRIQPEKTHS